MNDTSTIGLQITLSLRDRLLVFLGAQLLAEKDPTTQLWRLFLLTPGWWPLPKRWSTKPVLVNS